MNLASLLYMHMQQNVKEEREERGGEPSIYYHVMVDATPLSALVSAPDALL